MKTITLNGETYISQEVERKIKIENINFGSCTNCAFAKNYSLCREANALTPCVEVLNKRAYDIIWIKQK